MNMTKRQKTLLVIFFIGLAALTADRTFLRPQGGASAASADTLPPAQGSVLLSDNIPTLADQPARPGVMERLHRMWSNQDITVEQMRDPFSLPASWSDKVTNDTVRLPNDAARFVRGHQLTAVVVDGRESYVLVNDQLLVPGQCIDGFTLVAVGDRSAVFEQDGIRAVLELVGR
jgi:hypothetical protein